MLGIKNWRRSLAVLFAVFSVLITMTALPSGAGLFGISILTVDNNDGTATIVTLPVLGTSVQLPTENVPEPNLIGFTTKLGSSIATYAPGATFEATANATVYAIFSNTAILGLYNSDGSTNYGYASVTAGSSTTLPSTEPAPATGWVFSGWSLTAGATTATYAPGATYTPAPGWPQSIYAVYSWPYPIGSSPSCYTPISGEIHTVACASDCAENETQGWAWLSVGGSEFINGVTAPVNGSCYGEVSTGGPQALGPEDTYYWSNIGNPTIGQYEMELQSACNWTDDPAAMTWTFATATADASFSVTNWDAYTHNFAMGTFWTNSTNDPAWTWTNTCDTDSNGNSWGCMSVSTVTSCYPTVTTDNPLWTYNSLAGSVSSNLASSDGSVSSSSRQVERASVTSNPISPGVVDSLRSRAVEKTTLSGEDQHSHERVIDIATARNGTRLVSCPSQFSVLSYESIVTGGTKSQPASRPAIFAPTSHTIKFEVKGVGAKEVAHLQVVCKRSSAGVYIDRAGTIHGSATHNDVLSTTKAGQFVLGGAGNDTIYVRNPNAWVSPGLGNNEVIVTAPGATVTAGPGHDRLVADSPTGRTLLIGGTGNQTFVAEKGTVYINAKNGHGSDVIICLPGVKTVILHDKGDVLKGCSQ